MEWRRRRPQACANWNAAHCVMHLSSRYRHPVITIIHMIEHEHYCIEEGSASAVCTVYARSLATGCGINIHTTVQFSSCAPSFECVCAMALVTLWQWLDNISQFSTSLIQHNRQLVLVHLFEKRFKKRKRETLPTPFSIPIRKLFRVDEEFAFYCFARNPFDGPNCVVAKTTRCAKLESNVNGADGWSLSSAAAVGKLSFCRNALFMFVS